MTSILNLGSKIPITEIEGFGNLTNYVLQAPNGVFSVGADGVTITVKQGLTTLMPNGRDENYNLKNLKHVIEEEFSYTLQSLSTTYGRYVLVLDANNNLGYGSYCELDYIPTTYRGTWIRHIISNDIYEWEETTNSYVKKPTPLAVLGRVVVSNGKIIAYGAFNPPSLLKDSDIIHLSSLSLPSSEKYSLILGASGSVYTAPHNGYIHVVGQSTNAVAMLNLTNLTTGYNDYSPSAYAASTCTCNIPVIQGDQFKLNYISMNISYFLMIYAQGVV